MKIYSKKISKKYRKWHRLLKPAQKKKIMKKDYFLLSTAYPPIIAITTINIINALPVESML